MIARESCEFDWNQCFVLTAVEDSALIAIPLDYTSSQGTGYAIQCEALR